MENSKEQPDMKFVELAKVQGDFEAQVLKGMLESEGIEVAIRAGMSPNVLPFTVDGLGEVKLFVMENDLAAAQLLMKEYQDNG
jgi:hypothetical protein